MKIPSVKDDHEEYHQALGVFVEMYASTERMTHILLWTVAGVDQPTGQAIWPSVRVKTAIGTIRHLFAARQESIPALLDEAMSHLITITGLRDEILHYGTMPDEKGRLVDTQMQAYSEARRTRYRVSIPLLNSLTNDLRIIISRMATYPNAPKDDPDYRSSYDAAQLAALVPFLYIPPQPKSERRSSPSAAQESKRLRKSSRKKLLAGKTQK